MLRDRVKVSTSTEGTGTLSLGSAYTGFNHFDVLGTGTVSRTYYTVVNNAEWETGAGDYDGNAKTLTRDNIFESSNGGSRINISGQSLVFISYPARTSVYLEENQTPENGNLLFYSESGVQTRNLTSSDVTFALGYTPPTFQHATPVGVSVVDGSISTMLVGTQTIDVANENSVKYIIKAEYYPDVEILECLAVKGDGVVYSTMYGSLCTADDPLINVTTTATGGAINLVITAVNPFTQIKVFKLSL